MQSALGRTGNGIEVEWLDVDWVAPEARHHLHNLRKAAPLDRLLSRTIHWMQALPVDARPHALLQRYPRIANHVAASWHDPVPLRHYFDSLLIDRRGNRRGFPDDVLQELNTLRAFYSLRVIPFSRPRNHSAYGHVAAAHARP